MVWNCPKCGSWYQGVKEGECYSRSHPWYERPAPPVEGEELRDKLRDKLLQLEGVAMALESVSHPTPEMARRAAVFICESVDQFRAALSATQPEEES